ncbi:lasso RiPP family leader peptide-containing protein [Streptosporangium sp. NPDC000239]
MDRPVHYDRPMLVEVGDFADLTLGEVNGPSPDGGLPPFHRYDPDF